MYSPSLRSPRFEPWRPPGSAALWRRGLAHAIGVAFAPPVAPSAHAALVRELSDRGAMACDRLAATDEPLGSCMNYATQTLCAVLAASERPMGAPFKNAIIVVAKYSASIGAILAHAGRVDTPPDMTAVDAACDAMWGAIRADVPIMARETERLRRATDPLRALRALRTCAPAWPAGPPAWAV